MWWDRLFYVTQQMRDDAGVDWDAAFAATARRGLPAEYRITGDPTVQWSENREEPYYDAKGVLFTPPEWGVLVRFPVEEVAP